MDIPKRITLSEARQIVDVGVITFKAEELAAVLARLPPELEARGQTQYNIVPLVDHRGTQFYVAIVRAWEQGDLPAQSIAHALISDLSPRVLIVVGIAGGRPEKEFTLGDVIVANRMFDFNVTAANADGAEEFATRGSPVHRIAGIIAANLGADAGKYGDWNSEASIGMPRPRVQITSKTLQGNPDWQKKVREALGVYFGKGGRDRQPIVLDGPIGSSSTLMKDPVVFAKWLDKSREVKAVDMEIAGAHEAARSVQGDTPVIVLRGLSDIVGFKRDGRWTEYACRSAAAFCKALLTSGVLPLEDEGNGHKPPPANPPVKSKPVLLPVHGVNFVFCEEREPNGNFTIFLRVNLVIPDTSFTLMAFKVDYYAPDGCICLNGSYEMKINEISIKTAGNYFDFQTAVSVPNGVVQIAYTRQVRPPLMIQVPKDDCDYGDVRVKAKLLHSGVVEEFEWFFRLEPGGDLEPINNRREPPILSDSILQRMLEREQITRAEYDRASEIWPERRYQIIRFGNYITDAYSPTFGHFEVTDEFRRFLAGLHSRYLDSK
jgi:nucleoside phosphorylase